MESSPATARILLERGSLERDANGGKGKGREGGKKVIEARPAYIKRRLHRARIDECFSKSRRSGEELKRGKALPVSERRIERCVSDTPQIGGIFPDVFIALLSTTDPPRRVLATSRRVEGEWRWRARLRVENREILGCGELVLRARIKTRGQIFVLEKEREREGVVLADKSERIRNFGAKNEKRFEKPRPRHWEELTKRPSVCARVCVLVCRFAACSLTRHGRFRKANIFLALLPTVASLSRATELEFVRGKRSNIVECVANNGFALYVALGRKGGREEAKELGRISSRQRIYLESFRARIAGSNRKAAKLRLSAFIAARILKSF